MASWGGGSDVSRRRWFALAVAVAVTLLAQLWLLADGAEAKFVIVDGGVALAFILAGLVAWWCASANPIGTISIIGATTWQIGTLAMLTWDRPVTFVLDAGSRYHEVVLAALALFYPTGRRRNGLPTTLVVAMLALLAAGSVLKLLAQQPSAWGCDDCATNPLALSESEAFFGDAIEMIGRALGVCVAAVAMLVLIRWVRGSVPARRAAGLLPLAVVVWALFYVQDTWLRPIDALFVEGDNAFYVLGVARGLIPLSVVSGLLAIGVRQARLTHLLAGLGDNPRRSELEPALRAALGDSRLEVWWWSKDPPGYVGTSGERLTSLPPGIREATIELTADGQPMAVVRLDQVVLDDPRFAQAVSNSVRLVGDHERLSEQVRAQLNEVRASRRRILEAAANERARLERDLHDGSQQRLVGLALQLRLMRRSVDPSTSPELAESMDLASKNLGEALAELRELARGIHPAALTDGGLSAAMPLIADRVPVPIELRIELEGRLDPTIESTVYFVASEALTNAVKHSAAERVKVELRTDRNSVVLAVTDDGCGGASIDAGTGIAGLRDRVEAVGGVLWLESPAKGGTRLVAEVPLRAATNGNGAEHG